MPLTWRNVEAPRLDNRDQYYASQMFTGGLDRIADMFRQRAETNLQRGIDSGLANVYQYNDPAALQEAIASGALTSGMDPRMAENPNVRRQLMEAARGQVGNLTNQALSTEQLQASQAQSRLGGDIAALQIAARQGDPEAGQMLEQLRQQEGFGYVARDASDRFISGMEGHLGDVRDTRDFNYKQSRDAVADDQWMRSFNQSERHHNQRQASARSQIEREQLSLQRGNEAAHGFAAHFARLNPNGEEALSEMLRSDEYRNLQRNDPAAASLAREQFGELHQSYSGMSETERMANPVTARFVDAADSQMNTIRMNIQTERDELLNSDRESKAVLHYRNNQEEFDNVTTEDLSAQTGLSQSQISNILSRTGISRGELKAALDEFGTQGGLFTRDVTYVRNIADGVQRAARSNRPDRLNSLVDQQTKPLTEAMQRLNLEKRQAIVDATSRRDDRMDAGGETLQQARDFMGGVNQAFSRGNQSEQNTPSPSVRNEIERERSSTQPSGRTGPGNRFGASFMGRPLSQEEIDNDPYRAESERAAQARSEFFRGAAAPFQPAIDMNQAFGSAVLYPFTAIADRRRQLNESGRAALAAHEAALDAYNQANQPINSRQALEQDLTNNQQAVSAGTIIFSTMSFGDPSRFEQQIGRLSQNERQAMIEDIRSELQRVSTTERKTDLQKLLEIAKSKQ